MKRMDVVGFGAMNIDHLYEVDEIVLDGEQQVRQSCVCPGGSAANTVYCLAKLGTKAGFVGAVGDDSDGKKLTDDFAKVGIDTGGIRTKQLSPTGSTLCLSDKAGRRAIYVSPGANNSLTSDDIDMAYLNTSRVLHMSSFGGENQFNLQIHVTKQLLNSVTLSLSPGMFYVSRGLRVLTPLLERAAFVFMNLDEIEQLTSVDFRAGAKRLVKLGCGTVVVTLGKGLVKNRSRAISAYVRDLDTEYEVESERKNDFPVDTTGAGDAFAAGFLFGWLKGKSTRECGLLGDVLASFAIRAMGARTGLPTLAQLPRKYLQRSGNQL